MKLETVRLSPTRLRQIVDGFSRARIAVLGDFFLDKYLEIDPSLEEISVETGLPAHQVSEVRRCPGAAGAVVCNLASLGAGALHAIGFTGDDGEGADLRNGLKALNCSTSHLHKGQNRLTPTYLKPRNRNVHGLAGEHSRYDTKNRTPTDEALERQIIASLDALLVSLDALIIQDQVHEAECGVVTSRIRTTLAERAASFRDVVFLADSRRRIEAFRGVIVIPNQFEMLGDDHPQPGAVVELSRLMEAAARAREANHAPVVITRAQHGMLVSDPWTLVSGVRVDGPVDPTGAGDSATAGTVLALCAGASLPEAALVGNLVASISIQQLSTTGVATPEQLLRRFEVWLSQQQET